MSALESLTEVFAEGGHGDNSERFARELLAERRAEVLAEAARLADPAKPEVSFFGQYGPQVAWWLRMLVGRSEEATASATVAPELTVYRAENSAGIPLCTYTSLKAAQKHCESYARVNLFNRDDVPFRWVPDNPEDPAIWKLVARRGDSADATGYFVVVVDVATEYDPEADG